MFRGGWSISSSDIRRLLGTGERRALLGAGLALLGGCGFRPVNGVSRTSGVETDLAEELAAIHVTVIPERFGQLLRRNLQQRLTIGATPRAPRHELRVSPSLLGEAVGIDREGSATRIRGIATARWALVRIGPPEAVVASGFERSLDASNVPTNQFFAADSSREAAERRLADTLAQEVVTRVALALRRQAQPPA